VKKGKERKKRRLETTKTINIQDKRQKSNKHRKTRNKQKNKNLIFIQKNEKLF
jgi:hypothetical protein